MANNYVQIKRYNSSNTQWENVYPQTDWGYISNKPSTFTPSSHTHNYLSLSGGTLTSTRPNILTVKRNASYGAYIDYKNKNQDTKYWRVGMDENDYFKFVYGTSGGESNKVTIDTSGNFAVTGSITSSGDITLRPSYGLKGQPVDGLTVDMIKINSALDGRIVIGDKSLDVIEIKNDIIPSAGTSNIGLSNKRFTNSYITNMYTSNVYAYTIGPYGCNYINFDIAGTYAFEPYEGGIHFHDSGGGHSPIFSIVDSYIRTTLPIRFTTQSDSEGEGGNSGYCILQPEVMTDLTANNNVLYLPHVVNAGGGAETLATREWVMNWASTYVNEMIADALQ